mgnify:CR=1 FL=1
MTGVQKIGELEKRFREGSGKRYLRDGISMRCQGVSKTNLRTADGAAYFLLNNYSHQFLFTARS